MRNLLILMTLLIVSSAKSQSSPVSYNMWYQYNMGARLNDDLSLTTVAQYRSYDLLSDMRLFVGVAVLDYKLNKNVSVGVGNIFLIKETSKKAKKQKERVSNRVLQQVTLRDKIGRTSFLNRLRVEERFTNKPYEFKFAFRYFTILKIPFNKVDKKQVNYGIFRNEIRLVVDKKKPFECNILGLGTGFNLSKNSAVEVLLVNQLLPGKTNNYLQLGYRNKFDWRKKSK